MSREGYILKGTEAGTDSFISVATKSFKRRYMSLRQEIDGTCLLEFYKDNKKADSKGTICLDFCHQIMRVSAIMFSLEHFSRLNHAWLDWTFLFAERFNCKDLFIWLGISLTADLAS